MTKLKIDITFNSNCVLTVKDTTGFGGSEGFLTEGTTPSGEGNYKLSNGYFVNAVILNNYNCDPSITNKNEAYYHIDSVDVEPVYADNFTDSTYTLAKDGVYTFKRLFVISKAYYLANSGSITKTPIYYDPTEDKFIKVDEEDVELELSELVDAIDNTTTGSVIAYKFVSTCYLNKCLYTLQSNLLEKGLDICNTASDTYKKQRDYILMTLNVIKYLKEDGHLTEVQRVIENSNSCGLICKQISNESDCGCG